MALIDTYRDKLNRDRSKLVDLKKDLACEQKNVAHSQRKISDAQMALSRTNNPSTIKAKNRAIENATATLASSQDKIKRIQTKIASVEKDIANDEKTYNNEMEKINQKKASEENKRIQESRKRVDEMEKILARQNRVQQQLQREVNTLKYIPPKITVLFLSSNPVDVGQLRLDEEVRSIQEKIRLSDYRNSIIFESRWAMRTSDLLQAINEVKPTVVHFSGHGTADGELVFQDTEGNHKLVTKEAMAATLATLSDTIRLVVFNACFSELQAVGVVEHIEAAIGMSDTIEDDAARIFAAQLYSSIGFGLSLEKAFKQAKAALLLEGISEENKPQLFTRQSIHSGDIVLVQPS